MSNQVEIGLDGKAQGPLVGAPAPGASYTMGNYPVTSVVAYGCAAGGNIVSPFAESSSFQPETRTETYGTLKQQILKFAKAILLNPSKDVWICELRDGWLQIYLGEYGNVKSSINLGRIAKSSSPTP